MLDDVVSYVLAGWVVASAALFRLLPGRVAAVAVLVGGGIALPVAAYPAAVRTDGQASSSPMHALALPTAIAANRALAIGLGALCGVVLFDWQAVRRLRFRGFDAPVLLWIVVPLISAGVGGRPIAEGLDQVRYLALAWGVPYLLGRAYLADLPGLELLARGLAVAGLAYVPFCLAEIILGPFVYDLVYGPHPYRFEGADRLLGSRPLVFMEHGNQLGLWTATAALAAIALGRTTPTRAVLSLPAGAVASVLASLAILCQSAGSVLLLGAGAALFLIARGRASGEGGRRLAPDRRLWVLGFVAAAAVVVAMSWAVLGSGGLRQAGRDLFHGLGKSSFTWRLARHVDFLPTAAERPLAGWGRADWSPDPGGRFVNPVNLGLGLLAFGMYGIVGAAAVLAVFAAPVARLWARRGLAGPPLVVGTAALLLVQLGDAFSNSTILLPLVAAAGGLSGFHADDRPRPGRPAADRIG